MSLFTHEKTGCPWDEKDSAIRSAPKTIWTELLQWEFDL